MTTEMNFLWVALLAYVAAGTTALVAVVMNKRPERSVLALLVLGLALHAVAIALRWQRLGHGPFLNMFEVLSSNVWSLTLIFALAYWRVRALRPTAAVVMPVLFLMMGWLLVSAPGEPHLPPTYHTPWLYVHVLLGKIFLGSVLIAVGLAGTILWRSARAVPACIAALPADARLENLAFRFMILGFLFECLMLLAGAIWAQDAWGRFWAWDPLETWSFMTWLLLALFLHLRVTVKMAPRFSAVAIIAVFVLAFLTFFGVPFLSSGPHQGAI